MKFKIYVVFLVLAITISFNLNVVAASESHRNAAGQLLDTMDLNTLLAGTIESMLQLELSQTPALQPYENTMRQFFNKYMSGESLREDFIDIYVEAFTEKEINELNAFYSTPTGQKALKKSPAMMAQGGKIGQQRIQENISELQMMIQEEAKRIQKLQQTPG
ncbi:DUF2059 domain-containing protein [Desulfobacter curvatus]|uniref:DUF2059 domain-containing protein n=1 Tax=Desulfobacter curvatus TaxID=2290 RepID=UPI000364F95E|nr:DUF2059 domain-containing protein [Desulfobacter curvatus]